MLTLLPLWRGEFGRWVLLCKGAGRFGWREVGRLRPYAEDDRAALSKATGQS